MASRKRKGPGRPLSSTRDVREQIMDAAEPLFANLGYAGTTLREVAASAEVTQALINYYFGSKYGLFSQVFLRRGKQISERRMAHLSELERANKLSVENIIRAFLQPILELKNSTAGRAFIRLQARLHTEPPEISYNLRDDAYTLSTKEFVRAFQKALPHVSEREIYWRVTLMIGAYMYAFSDTHRLDEIAPSICNPENPYEVLDEITAFVASGMQASYSTPSR